MELPIAAGWSTGLDGIGTWLAVVLTLFVFSYLLGDNALYRLAEHIFVGAAVGYVVVIAVQNVLLPKLFQPFLAALWGGDWQQLQLLLFPLLLGLLLLTKAFPRVRAVSWLGSLAVAVLLGVGAALAIGGALLGTLWPQVNAAADITRQVPRYGWWLGVFSGLAALVGSTGVLLHLSFSSGGEGWLARQRRGLVRIWGGVGRWFIVVTFGALLATTFVSRLSFLVARFQFLLDAVRGLAGG